MPEAVRRNQVMRFWNGLTDLLVDTEGQHSECRAEDGQPLAHSGGPVAEGITGASLAKCPGRGECPHKCYNSGIWKIKVSEIL